MIERNLFQEFQHKDVLRLFPWIKARTLISWVERGLVKPDFQDAAGKGTRRGYSYKNLIEILLVDELLSWGISYRDVGEIAHGSLVNGILKTSFDEDLPNLHVWKWLDSIEPDRLGLRPHEWRGICLVTSGKKPSFSFDERDRAKSGSMLSIHMNGLRSFVDQRITENK